MSVIRFYGIMNIMKSKVINVQQYAWTDAGTARSTENRTQLRRSAHVDEKARRFMSYFVLDSTHSIRFIRPIEYNSVGPRLLLVYYCSTVRLCE